MVVWVSRPWSHGQSTRLTHLERDPIGLGTPPQLGDITHQNWRIPNSLPSIPKDTPTPLPTWEAGCKHHLPFIELPRHKNVKQNTGLSKSFHVTIFFDTILKKNLKKGSARSLRLNRVHKMKILLGTEYSSPIDIGLNQITKNWAAFSSYISSYISTTRSKLN